MDIDWYNNVASRFLKKLGELRKVVPAHALPILDFLDIFREIQKGCFSWTLCNNYSTLIKDFVKSVKYLQTYCPSTLKISFSISWKLHMVCCHLEPLLDRPKCGLAMVCEQAGEAVHTNLGGARPATSATSTIPSTARPSTRQWSSGSHRIFTPSTGKPCSGTE